jgi:DNA-binding NtrC family response regulator
MIDFVKAVYEYKLSLILPALESTGGNIERAAKLLMLKRTTLVEMMKILKINKDEFRTKRKRPALS